MRLPQTNRGSTLILTMIFVSIFATLAVAYTAATNMNLQQADSHRKAQSAQLAAESGLAHAVAILRGMQLNSAGSDEDMLQAAADLMAATLDGTANLGGASITFDETTLRTPDIPFAATGQTYRVEMNISSTAGSLDITVYGTAGGVTRGLQLQMTSPNSTIFNFGVASRSRIEMIGNAKILGANDPREANILSTTYSVDEAVKLAGNCKIEGDISTSNPGSYVTATGNAEIGGESDWDDMQDHIHIGIGDVPFPEVDPTVFEPFATTIVDGSTKTSNETFENIRILAGTDPTFSGNTTVLGVVYIEQPNVVKFTGNLHMTGVIVTEDAGDDAYDTNTIQFTGNMNFAGVDDLPEDEPQFTELKQMPGSMLLAPGFGVKFTGNFNTVNGTIAADKFTFTGNAKGTIAGSVICYSDSDFTLTGNSSLTIDRSQYTGDPPGFARLPLGPVAGSYLEL